MSAELKRRYPAEMMVVLQEWFADLAVMPDRFSVTLNFGNVPEPIVVPFDAVKTFVDPSVQFGLKFDSKEGDGSEGFVAVEMEDDEDEPTPPGRRERSGGDAEIVSLDKFRKH
jgi:hypothetical protein